MFLTTMSSETLNFAESAFSSVLVLKDLPPNVPFLFRIVSEIKGGWSCTAQSQFVVGEEPKNVILNFREIDKSKALKARVDKSEEVWPFMFFCAYLPSKNVLRMMKITSKPVMEEITKVCRQYEGDPGMMGEATCQIIKTETPGKPYPSYAFSVCTTLDSRSIPQVHRSPISPECLELMARKPFDLNKIYTNEDPFLVD
jgi:hypothetical protein